MTQNWFVDWFASDYYQEVYNHRNNADAQKLIDLILSKTLLPANSWVLDAACGFGRHSQIFSNNNMNVVGFDLSMKLLKNAKSNLKESENTYLVRGDFRNIYFKKKFDLISNLFTSFGYFESDQENFSFAENSIDFIKQDGFFVFDYFNRSYLEKNLVPHSERKIGDLDIIEKREIKDSRVVKEINLIGKESNNFYESVKLYDSLEIIENFFKIGYKPKNIFGDYLGNNFDEENSERLVIFFSL